MYEGLVGRYSRDKLVVWCSGQGVSIGTLSGGSCIAVLRCVNLAVRTRSSYVAVLRRVNLPALSSQPQAESILVCFYSYLAL